MKVVTIHRMVALRDGFERKYQLTTEEKLLCELNSETFDWISLLKFKNEILQSKADYNLKQIGVRKILKYHRNWCLII